MDSVCSFEDVDSEGIVICFSSQNGFLDVSNEVDSIKTSSGKDAVPKIIATTIAATPKPIRIPFFMGNFNCLFSENKQNGMISLDE